MFSDSRFILWGELNDRNVVINTNNVTYHPFITLMKTLNNHMCRLSGCLCIPHCHLMLYPRGSIVLPPQRRKCWFLCWTRQPDTSPAALSPTPARPPARQHWGPCSPGSALPQDVLTWIYLHRLQLHTHTQSKEMRMPFINARIHRSLWKV